MAPGRHDMANTEHHPYPGPEEVPYHTYHKQNSINRILVKWEKNH